jgi:nucleoid-associated protein YgaU
MADTEKTATVSLRDVIDSVRGNADPRASATDLIRLLASKVREQAEEIASLKGNKEAPAAASAQVEAFANEVETSAEMMVDAIFANTGETGDQSVEGTPPIPAGPPVAGGHGTGSRYETGGGAGAGQEAMWHTVRQGDNLSSLARDYGVTVEELKTLNSLSDPNRITAGTRLRIR